VNRPFVRALLALGVVVAVLAGRAAGCRKSSDGARAGHAVKTPPHWITPLMTPPPPRPTVTMWKGATRVPQLPE
jgi:hypothetical protein